MNLDLGRVFSRAFSISWRHRWLWLLGVFGGGGAGFRANFNSMMPGRGGPGGTQLARLLSDNLGIVVALLVALVVIVLVAAVLACVAVPAATWAALQIDAGREVRLGMAWRAGLERFWRYLRLSLLKLGSGAVVALLALGLVALGILVFGAAGPWSLVVLIPAGVLLALAGFAGLLVISIGLTWSDRMLVILGVGAVDSVRAGWWLFTHNKLATVLVTAILVAINVGIGIGVAVAAVVVSIPGIVMLFAYFGAAGGSTALAAGGFTWVIVVGGAVFLAGSGFIGAVTQVALALAARDLAVGSRLSALPEVIAYDPPHPAGLVPAT